MSKSNVVAAVLVVGCAVTSCGKLEPSAQRDGAAPATTSTSPVPAGALDYVITFPGAQSQTFDVQRRSLARFSFDLSQRLKAAAPEVQVDSTLTGAPVAGSNDPQVRLIGIDGMDALCGTPLPPTVETAANLKLIPHDAVDLTRLQLAFDLVSVTEPFPANVGVCYGIHASGGGWTWSSSLVPIAFDSPWVYGGPDGAGHVDLPTSAKKIDMIAVVFNENVTGLFLRKATYTGIPSL